MYTVHPNEQMLIFLASLGVGFLFGVLYDVFRAVRMAFLQGKLVVVFFDLLYFFLVAFFSYIFIIASNKGEVRSYIIIGELLGAVFYYFSLGIVVMKLTNRFVDLLKRIYSFVFKIISFPFRLVKLFLKSVFSKLQFISEKNKKNLQKISKKVLPKWRMYVYNLLGILCVGSVGSRKGGKANAEGEKENPTQSS